MSRETYHLLHIAGMLFLFLGLGGCLLAAPGGKASRMGIILHGIGMVTLLFAGIGAIYERGIGFPWPLWIWCKLVVWMLLGGLPAMYRRDVIPANIAWAVALLLGVAAAYLSIFRPFG